MNPATRAYARATELDRRLGDPRDPDNPCGFAAAAARDLAESFPKDLADAAGPALRLSFVPEEHGGDLVSADTTLMLVRAAARRDATVMPATMFSITAATCVLLSGSAEQREHVVRVLRGGGAVGFALSEDEHGSDLLANSCAAVRDGTGTLHVDGDKWLVGLGERCTELLLVARTGGRGPAAFSTMLLSGAQVEAARTDTRHGFSGMRGVDFASFSFEGLRVPDRQLVGLPGRGLETAMKAMQVVRTMSTGASLACADTGLRLTVDFAARHRVAGSAVLDHPHGRRELATAGALLFAGDAVALAAARGLHVLPAAQSLWSSVAKKILTEASEEVFDRCADVLGTRAVLRDGTYGAFDTARRDNAVVRFIDTGPVANSRLVTTHLGRLSAAWRDRGRRRGEAYDELAAVCRVGTALPPLRLDALELSDRGGDAVFDCLPTVAEAARSAVMADRTVAPRDKARTAVLINFLERVVDRVLTHAGKRYGQDRPLAQHDLVHQLCYAHAAVTCLHLWWFNRSLPLFGAPPGSTGWLNAVLTVLLDRAWGQYRPLPDQETGAVIDIVEALHAADRMFSCTALPLADSSAPHRT